MSVDRELLLPYQKAWIADDSKVAICEKSRRTGMSWTEALAQVLIASRSKGAGGQNCLYLAYNKDMTRQFIEDAKWWAEQIERIAYEVLEETIWKDPEHPEKDILVYTMRFASGFSIQALPSKPTALRSKQGRVCIDEAAFVDDLGAIQKAAMALLMWGGQVRFISTHNGVENPFNELVLEGRAKRKPYKVHRVDLDTALEQGLYRRICLTSRQKWNCEKEAEWREGLLKDYGEGASEELFCMPQGTAGKYFSRFLLDTCAIRQGQIVRSKLEDAVLHYQPKQKESIIAELFDDYLLPPLKRAHGRVYIGRDFARSGDLSCAWFFELDGAILRHLALLEMRNWPHTMQRDLVFKCVQALGHHFACGAWDARGNGEAEAEWFAVEYGNMVEQVKATTAWYNENFPKLKARFQDGNIEIPNDDLVLDDFRAVVVKNGVPVIGSAMREKDNKSRRHGDTAIAAVMAEYAYQKDDGGYYPIEFAVVAPNAWAAPTAWVAHSEWDNDGEQDEYSWD